MYSSIVFINNRLTVCFFLIYYVQKLVEMGTNDHIISILAYFTTLNAFQNFQKHMLIYISKCFQNVSLFQKMPKPRQRQSMSSKISMYSFFSSMILNQLQDKMFIITWRKSSVLSTVRLCKFIARFCWNHLHS